MRRALPIALALAAACGGPQPGAKPPPPDAAPPPVTVDDDGARELADGLLEVLGLMAQVVEEQARACVADEAACATTCAQIAAGLGQVFDQAEPLFALARDAARDPASSRRLADALDRHADAVAPLERAISAGLAACRDEPALVEVIERMPTL